MNIVVLIGLTLVLITGAALYYSFGPSSKLLQDPFIEHEG
jgi:hypothetical protein